MSAASKVRNIVCSACSGTGAKGAVRTASACRSCSGYGKVSEHSLAECWCDGTESALDHENH